jgi:hypothetical protein
LARPAVQRIEQTEMRLTAEGSEEAKSELLRQAILEKDAQYRRSERLATRLQRRGRVRSLSAVCMHASMPHRASGCSG